VADNAPLNLLIRMDLPTRLALLRRDLPTRLALLRNIIGMNLVGHGSLRRSH
jgi:hypothetical protein